MLPQPGIYPWHLGTNGWIVSSSDQRYIWLPSDMHRFLHSPQQLVISSEGSVKVDFTNARMGTEWAECFDRSS
ncbi:hypothetical protein FB451DRAFT_1238289 [Mycena latifolia]|nr:hypothetical protein FB451DRAFT_1238289 [Mycena latifolia]